MIVSGHPVRLNRFSADQSVRPLLDKPRLTDLLHSGVEHFAENLGNLENVVCQPLKLFCAKCFLSRRRSKYFVQLLVVVLDRALLYRLTVWIVKIGHVLLGFLRLHRWTILIQLLLTQIILLTKEIILLLLKWDST